MVETIFRLSLAIYAPHLESTMCFEHKAMSPFLRVGDTVKINGPHKVVNSHWDIACQYQRVELAYIKVVNSPAEVIEMLTSSGWIRKDE